MFVEPEDVSVIEDDVEAIEIAGEATHLDMISLPDDDDVIAVARERGNGAVLPEPERGRELAHAMRSTAADAGLPLTALLTDMSEPLARSAGNALEVREAVAMLRNESADARLLEVTLALGAEVLTSSRLAPDEAAARQALAASLASGAAAERFARMVASLGGPADFLQRSAAYLPTAPVVRDVPAAASGTVTAIDSATMKPVAQMKTKRPERRWVSSLGPVQPCGARQASLRGLA